MKNLLSLSLIALGLLCSFTAHASSGAQCAPIERGDETDYSATNVLIAKQKTCAQAAEVFNRCPHGAMYSNYEGSSVLDQSATLIAKCEKAIKSRPDVKKAYNFLTKKLCSSPDNRGTRTEIAKEDECFRELSVSIGTQVEQ